MDQREERVGRNEALFREVNEGIRGVTPPETAMFEVLCECGSATCTEGFPISATEYEHVRSDPAHFVLISGHEAPSVEDVVEDEGVFVVVRKHAGEPERLARATDPS